MLPGINESDWKLFRSRIADWQENYMSGLIAEYAIILQDGSKNPSDRFWKIVDRIKEDKKAYGVSCERKRSSLIENMIMLYAEGAINDSDLEGFSEELIRRVHAANENR